MAVAFLSVMPPTLDRVGTLRQWTPELWLPDTAGARLVNTRIALRTMHRTFQLFLPCYIPVITSNSSLLAEMTVSKE
jgi:hypothetical protein